MSEGGRLVEYFLVVGVDKEGNSTVSSTGGAEVSGLTSPVSPLSPLSEHMSRGENINLAPPDVKVPGAVLQRFPTMDRKDTTLPGGIEIFCQPLGWFLTYTSKPPTYIDFILTAEDSRRLYCTTLNFHQPWREPAPKQTSKKDPLPRHVSTSAVQVQKHREMKRKPLSLTKVDYLDEGCEESWTVKDAYGELYQPVSLCIVSRLPLFESFKMCLKAFYIPWVANNTSQTLHLEEMVADLLSGFKIPFGNCLPVKRPFGALKELVVPPIHEETTLPYTSTSALWLLRRVGVHQLLQLVSAIISDFSILFISSSLTTLTSSLRALSSIVYPFNVSHSIVPVVPMDLLDYTQLPSTYIMGIHSSLRELIDIEMLEVVEVYLDEGHLVCPETITIPYFPSEVIAHVQVALARVLDDNYDGRDLVFRKPLPLRPLGAKGPRSEEDLDREVRAIFICLLAILLGDYQNYVTVLRFQPTPAFYFNLEAYLANKEGGTDHQGLIYKMAESIAFFNFCHERSVPYRQCDFFDELVARFASNPQDLKLENLFSWDNIQELTEDLYHQLPPCSPPGGPEFDLKGANPEALNNPLNHFPTLSSEVIAKLMSKYEKEEESDNVEEVGSKCRGAKSRVPDMFMKRKIPLLDSTPTHRRQSSTYLRDMDSLTSCLDAMFQSKIIEARKYVPSVIQALKKGVLSDQLIPALVVRFLQYGVLLSTEQFDVVVKLLNSALVDQKSAMMLLPLTTVIYREVNPGVQQHACTCLQNHYIWEKLTFWKDAIFLAIQAELVRVYAEVEAEYKRSQEEPLEEVEPDAPDGIGDITLRSRQRLRSDSPTRIRAKASKVFLSRSARMRMRASVVVPGASEGVLPPNSKPVTSQEALHHLAKILDMWETLSEEKRITLMRIEENAISNQLILFVQRVISLRTPVELPDDEEEQAEFMSTLELFIVQLLRMVEVDLTIDLSKFKIRDQIRDMILIHLDSMAGLRKELKRLPISKPKVIKPPLLSGETLLFNVPAFLLQDGRDNNLMLPADGQVFLTSYRIIFLGTPCDPQAPNLIVTRSMPVSSVYRFKKLNPTPLPPPISISTVGGLQIRSTTAELLKIGFDDDTSPMDIKNLEQHIIDLRNPSTITLGVKVLNPMTSITESTMSPERDGTTFTHSITRQQFRAKAKNENRNKAGANVLHQTSTLTRVKLLSEMSQSPCCMEYSRMDLGSINFKDSKRGSWRTTTLNLSYTVCSSYPAVLVVPTKVTDECLAALAGQFQHNRWPVVTWKHPKKEAVLLRSSSFVPSSITRKKFNAVSGKLLPSSITQKHLASDEALQNRAGVGVNNKEVENYFYDLMLVSPANRSSLDLVNHISMPPPMMEFEEELRRQGSFRAHPPPSPSPSNDSSELEAENLPQESVRSRAATYAYKIRTRVGSSVSQLSRIAVPNEKKPFEKSPAAKRKLSARRKVVSSPQLTKRKQDIEDRHSSCSTSSDISMEKDKWRESLKEEPEIEEDTSAVLAPRSADTSPTTTKKHSHKRTHSSGGVGDMVSSDIDLKDIVVTEKSGSPGPPVSPIDWEAVENRSVSVEKDDAEFCRASRCSVDDDQSQELLQGNVRENMKLSWDHFSDQKQNGDVSSAQSPGSFSTLPTNPRDWMVMDALPSELGHWRANALYILGDKAVLQDIPDDLYPNCMFVPVEAPSLSDVSNSFKKLMRACTPSAPQGAFFSAIQESGWVTQLTHLMQLGGAVADLIDIQGSSVLVCLENGWDTTAQVVSIAQILLDPYYRTIEGFKMLVEKDWLSFGHRFTHNGSHTSATSISSFAPIFLQFLDVVHQIMKQFPLSFEFNDFYLRTLAYHHCSMRFHTFSGDSEKERYANNWLRYRPRTAAIYGSSGQTEEYVSFWEHIDNLHKDSMVFYNFRYQCPNELDDQGPLRAYSYQANIDVWSFYLDNHISVFPPYDTELISEGALTLLDMHHNFFEKERSLPLTGLRINQPGSVANEISSLLWQYTKLMNLLAEKHGLPQATWKELLEELLTSSPTDLYHTSIRQVDNTITSHGQTLHKRTTLAVLIKGKLAVELETQFTTPHQFEPLDHGHVQHECAFCKHQVNRGERGVAKCKKCGCVCHAHCKSQMPYNCGQERQLKRRLSKRLKAKNEGPELSNWSRHASSIFFHNKGLSNSPQVSEGYLYKRGKIVKNWKQRWFVLDPEKGEMSYYDSNSDGKCHGTIQLRDIISLEEAEPQVVPSLKPGESSFFFNVVTQKRVYHLMALRAVERTEWMIRIKSVI